jgi:ParB family chromosome partitioning protein
MPRKPPPLTAPSRPAPLPAADRTRSVAGGAFGFENGGGRLREVAIGALRPNPQQPRRVFDDDALEHLARTIDTLGLMFPPTVRELADGYELVAGERRWRACQRIGHTTIPVLIVEPDDDAQALAMALAENAAREPLNAVEEAHAFAALLDGSELTQQELGRRVGKSQEDVSNSIRLLNLPDVALKLLMEAKLTKAHGKVLLSEPDHHQRAKLARISAREGWSVRRLQHEVRRSAVAKPSRRGPSADMTAAAARWTEVLRQTTGQTITMRASNSGFQLDIGDADAARELLRLLGVPAEALDERAA